MARNDGLWVVEFKSSVGLFGKGVLVLDGDRLLGGDFGYYYSGHCREEGDRVKGEIDVIRFDPNAISVFGDVESFAIKFDGKVTGSDITAHATSDHFPGVDMIIEASKKEDLLG